MKKKSLKKLLAGAALCSLLVAPLFLNEEQGAAIEQTVRATPDFGVGQGIEWPEQVVAPFVDITAYTSDEVLSNKGALNMAEIARETGQRFFNLGFMQTRGIKNGKLDWAWGSFNGLSESDNDKWQYEGIKQSIRELREVGGDAAVSFGGLNSGAFWEVAQDEDMLYDAYMEVIQGYGFTRIDFDVEAGAMGYHENLTNAKAVKRLQDATGVDVTLTLPVMPTGLISTGLSVLQAYLEAGVDLTNVNIMTMCYGSSVTDYAQGSLDAVDNTMIQLKNHYKQYAGKTLTDEQAYAKLGTTPSVGFENEQHPYFTTDMFNLVVQHAKERKIGMVSYWSMNRDAKVDGGQGQVKNQYEFLTVGQRFTDGSEMPEDTQNPSTPTNVGSDFITTQRARINWTASTDNDRIARYNLKLTGAGETVSATTMAVSHTFENLKSNTTYTVEVIAEDRSGNISDAATYTFTTLEESESTLPTWDPETVYFEGDRVTYEGLIYEAKYWTQNDIPSESGPYGPWSLVTE
ncbi:fibronectin type III domain-containing protein [Enterococcus spodopteracolus]|uniref:fibronectin type III domain-containing protein n=1 Tax=Enterococcus spodopteracolus TaxID=3034501 RepID=UPI0026499722|nr:carbohydrate-binding protein [Enterococcus spodopteracolus]